MRVAGRLFGLVVSGALMLGTGQGEVRTDTPSRAAREPAPFTLPLRVPEVLDPVERTRSQDRYRVVMRTAEAEILPGERTPVWGYQGSYPGPTIVARRGRRVVVTHINRLPDPTSVHLHGGKVRAASDGHPLDLIAPGSRYRYRYPNRQRPATYWYHDHADRMTGRHVYMGLAGFYLVRDPAERSLGLPRGRYDVPLVVQDRTFNDDGSLWFPEGETQQVVGDTVVVNGVAQPFFEVKARKYRFRLLNGANSTPFEFALANGDPLIQIATDAGLMPNPVARESVLLFPAERADVVIDFSGYEVGTSVVLRNLAGSGTTSEVMRFDVVGEAEDRSRVPSTLRRLPPLHPPDRTRSFRLSFDSARELWTFNGAAFDPKRIDARPRIGETEVWRFVNESGLAHPIHLHEVSFQILDRNGRQPPPWEVGLKDTVVVHPGETVRISITFRGYPGTYVFHCHNLQHEDHGMMAQFELRPRR